MCDIFLLKFSAEEKLGYRVLKNFLMEKYVFFTLAKMLIIQSDIFDKIKYV